MAIGSADYIYQATVANLVDADTIDLDIDLGFSLWISERVRVYGINAPESRTSNTTEKLRGMAAKQYAATLLPLGTQIRVQTAHTHEKYGRFLATITLPDGTDFATRMIEANHAVPYFGGAR